MFGLALLRINNPIDQTWVASTRAGIYRGGPHSIRGGGGQQQAVIAGGGFGALFEFLRLEIDRSIGPIEGIDSIDPGP